MKLITAFFMAWGMFCAVPCPLKRWDAALKPLMLACFPLIGLLTGAVWALLAEARRLLGGLGLFGAAALCAAPYLLTGFIHLDGFMDCCDAILSRRALAERRRILKDSHVGSFAVIGVLLLVLFSFSLFATAGPDFGALRLMFVSCSARCASALAVTLLPPMEGSSYVGVFDGVRKGPYVAFLSALCALSAALPVVFYGPGGLAAAGASAAAAMGVLWGCRSLGGMSGDIAGLAVTLGELGGVALITFLR